MNFILSWFYWTFRPLIKVLLRKATNLCELQRICYNNLHGARRSCLVEVSLQNSKQKNIKSMIVYMDDLSARRKLRENVREALNRSIDLILTAKSINPKVHLQFVRSMSRCVEHIWGYRQLIEELTFLSKMNYDSHNPEHEEKLLKLWTLLSPDAPLTSRVSHQWKDIGFQGNDPKTDFRGMGILGLDNLIFFAEEYCNSAQRVLQYSLHPIQGFAFAILGINLTSLAYHLFSDGHAKTHVFNVSHRMPNIDVFHHFYCFLFCEFNKFWIKSSPSDIMDFLDIRQKFEVMIRERLEDDTCVLSVRKNEMVNVWVYVIIIVHRSLRREAHRPDCECGVTWWLETPGGERTT